MDIFKITPIEWYKRPKWHDPDIDEQNFLRCWGEWGVGFQMAFDKHLAELNKIKIFVKNK